MLMIIKAQQVVSTAVMEPKPWDFNGKQGITHTAKMAVIGSAAECASVTLKAKTAEELQAKLKKYPAGKSAEIEVTEIVPVFRQGDRKPTGYEFTA